MTRLVKWKDGVVQRLTKGVQFLCDKANVEVVHGRAVFAGPRALRIETESGVGEVTFQQAIIATGSSPVALPGLPFDGSRIVGPREALSPTDLPGRVVVVGGGYIGLGLASTYAKLGSKVSVVEGTASLLWYLDPEIGDTLKRRMEKLGVSFMLSNRAEAYDGGASLLTVVDASGNRSDVSADLVIVTAGRQANSSGIGLDAAGVATDARGFITVNERLETNSSGIHAIGDVTGGPLLAHKAYREAKVVAGVIGGEPVALDNVVIPGIVFTDPEVAWVGMSEKDAREAGVEVRVGTFPLRASGGALAISAGEGFVKTVADAATGRILGVFAVGRGVTELISKAGLAIEMGALLDDVTAVMEPHPTMSEALLESAEAALGTAIHVVKG
jgi:dihydrolipoamide dehydrogenase